MPGRSRILWWVGWLVGIGMLFTVVSAEAAPAGPAMSVSLTNPGFECTLNYHPQPGVEGLIPDGWTAQVLEGFPGITSARMYFTYQCGQDGFVERLEDYDSLVFLSQDIETPPEPGKPFDALIYQQASVTPGAAYSVSGWMVSLCGGSFSNPNDCPPGYYMSKMLGLDPTGGTDPNAPSVIWVEDRRNFTESRWVNLRLSATAQTDLMTIFVRVRSPFRWHGNHAFADAVSLVQAPEATFTSVSDLAAGQTIPLAWSGNLGPDIPQIPNSAHQLRFDLQYRFSDATWTNWLIGQEAGSAIFTSDRCLSQPTYEFRIRARAEQPVCTGCAWPDHRYTGEWSDPVKVAIATPSLCTSRTFLPGLTGPAQ